MSARRLSADWVVPVDGPPIRDGAVLIGDDGRIASVGPGALVPRPEAVPSEHLAGTALMPGLVNTHTHLELTDLASRLEEPGFPDWIRSVRRLKAGRTAPEYLAAASEGLRRCLRSGVTTVADTGDTGATMEALRVIGGSGIAYHEVFGPDPAQLEESMAGLIADLDRLRQLETSRARLGVSPHAPYSVSGPLYRASASCARELGLPIAVHLAESAAESALLATGAGPFADLWKRRSIPLPADVAQLPLESGVVSPVRWLDHHGVLGPETLCIHAIRVDATDLALLRDRGAAVAHCPISNARHGHGWAPVDRMLEAGLRVGLGTDSELSIGPLDLWAEARAARNHFGLSADLVLRMLTLGGAAAIGLEAEVGSLVAGKWGDVVAISLGGPCSAEALTGRLLERGGMGLSGVWLGGCSVLP